VATRSVDETFVARDATIDDRVILGRGTKVWGLAHIREGATIGASCVVGRGSYVGPGVIAGDNCKIQNNALVYEPAILGDGVFIGPGATLTNDLFPRAVNPNGDLKTATDWDPVGVVIEAGASIGAGAVCVAPVKIGSWAMVAAGAVVTKDVKPFSLVRGVPAHHVGWVGRAGHPLLLAEGLYRCPQTGEEYREEDGVLAMVEAAER